MSDGSSSISVAIRVRPLSTKEAGNLAAQTAVQIYNDASLSGAVSLAPRSAASIRKILRVLDDRVLVFDPLENNPMSNLQRQLLGPNYKKKKDMRFCFDKVFDEDAQQQDVYDGIAKDLIGSVLNGFNSTIFAYGATGCGKTHTISGTPECPGIIFLLMKDLFDSIQAKEEDSKVELSLSYLEIYNEQIRDLLADDSTICLGMRENDKSRIVVPGLSEHVPTSAEEVITMIHQGNLNRSTNHTEANATSSRSHAVLSVNVKIKPRTADISEDYSLATLSVIDLAGSERASVTKNKGERLFEGANINRSLLALGNCINALCDPRRRGHVPYRDSKLTRLLKHSLSGSCRTAMIVCVSPSSQHYDETHNTLQYANRAKQIKTKATRNVISVDRHVSQYVKIIYELRQELEARKLADASREEKARDAERSLRSEALREVQEGLRSIQTAQEDALVKASRAATAKAELGCLESFRPILLRWRKHAFPSDLGEVSPGLLDVISRMDSLINSLASRGQSLIQETKQATNAQSIYEANVANLRRRLKHPEASDVLDSEVKMIDLTLRVAKEQAKEAGQNEGSKAQARILVALFDARNRLLNVQDMEESNWKTAIAQLDAASQRTFTDLAGMQAEIVPMSAARGNAPSLDLPSMSPVKSARSPRKARTGGLKSSIISSPRKRAPKVEKKSVVWKDEAGEGWELEDQLSMEADAKAKSGPLNTSSPPSDVFNPVPTPQASTKSAADVKAMLKPSSSRLSSGFLSRNKPDSAQANRLPDLTEDSENTPPSRSVARAAPASKSRLNFLKEDPYRQPLGDFGNASVSSANSSFGDASSLSVNPARSRPSSLKRLSSSRRSSVGPVRSAKKSRRVSWIAPTLASQDDGDQSNSSMSIPARARPGRAPRATLPSPKHSPVKRTSGSSIGLNGGRLAGRMSLAPTAGASPIWR